MHVNGVQKRDISINQSLRLFREVRFEILTGSRCMRNGIGFSGCRRSWDNFQFVKILIKVSRNTLAVIDCRTNIRHKMFLQTISAIREPF